MMRDGRASSRCFPTSKGAPRGDLADVVQAASHGGLMENIPSVSAIGQKKRHIICEKDEMGTLRRGRRGLPDKREHSAPLDNPLAWSDKKLSKIEFWRQESRCAEQR
jgi:hypothetical protein